jgi:hypothetical protein
MRDLGLAPAFIFARTSLLYKDMSKLISSFILIALSITSFSAHAFVSPLSVGIFPPVQFPPSDFGVTGVRASLLWGNHRDMYGLDFGLLGNVTQQDFVGVGLSGVFNLTRGTTRAIGLQAAGITNMNFNKTYIYGVQVAALLNYNEAESVVSGLQLSLVNISKFTNIYGVQFGLYNQAQDVYGLQIGVVNIAKNLHGLQIGLINFNSQGIFAVSPILNVGF